MTRLDRWYVPMNDKWADFLMTITQRNDLWTSDHDAVVLTIDTQRGSRGRDVKTIDENIYKEEEVLLAAAREVRKAYAKTQGTHSDKWEAALVALKEHGFSETRKRRKKRSIEIERIKIRLEQIEANLKSAPDKKRTIMKEFIIENQ